MQCRGRFARDASAAPTREARDRAFRSIWPMRGSQQARAADRLLFRRNHADQMTTSHSAAHQSDRGALHKPPDVTLALPSKGV